MKHLSFIILFFIGSPVFGREGEEASYYEEISVYLNVQKVGGLEISAVIRGEDLYLPVTDVFNFLKINNTLSENYNNISGFFIHETSLYLIDKHTSLITFNKKIFDIGADGLIRTETNLYLKIGYFNEIFGLQCTFNFRSLSVVLETNLELPVIREMRLAMMRQNIKKLKGELKADTTIGRRYSFFQLGMADWSFLGIQELGGASEIRMNVRLGAMLAGGDANINVQLNDKTPFDLKQQFYQWRLVNNNLKALRQITLGQIPVQSTSTIFAPVVGMHITNTSTANRKSFGTYTLSDITEPNWIVELYINNVLIDYVRADVSGFFTFEVPLVYGVNMMNLRFYGPSGEERSSERNISIPFSFLPKNIFEYAVSVGLVTDSTSNRFSRGQFNYGLGNRVTIGGGIEYLSAANFSSSIPFVNTTIRLTSNMLITGEYNHRVRSRALINYRLPTNFQLELSHTRYALGQQSINHNFLEEKKLAISRPVRMKQVFLFSRLAVNQVIVPTINYAASGITKYDDIPKQKITSAELLLSASASKLSANLNTNLALRESFKENVFSNLTLAYRSSSGVVFRPGVQFDYIKNSFVTGRFEVEKSIQGKAFLNLMYEHNFSTRSNILSVGFRYDLSFARTAFLANRRNKKTVLTHAASGSFMYDGSTNYIAASNRVSVGKGAITILPFLDINCNGKRDTNEPRVKGLKLRINGGRVIRNDNSSIIRVVDLEPNINYLIEIDGNNFDYISWQIKNKNISVVVDPNSIKQIEIPVSVLGEASGMVYVNEKDMQKGISRIRIKFYDSSSRLVAQTLSEGDGYFSHLGFAPGVYTAKVDAEQLQKIHMKAHPELLTFEISASEEGVVADGLAFVLQSLEEDALLPNGMKPLQ